MLFDPEKRLISELALDTALSKDQKILEKALTLIWQELFIRVFDEVSEQDKDDCEAYLEKEGATPQAMISFLSARCPDQLNRMMEESFQRIVREIKPILDRSRGIWTVEHIDKLSAIAGKAIQQREKRKRRQRLFLKIVGPVVGWVVSWLLFIMLAKLGIIPLWVIPNWMKRMFW